MHYTCRVIHIFTLVLLCATFAFNSQAQTAPDFLFTVSTGGDGNGPLPTSVVSPGSWSGTYGPNNVGSVILDSSWSGSTSGSGVTLSATGHMLGTYTGIGTGYGYDVRHGVEVWIKGPANATLSATSDLSLTGTTSDRSFGPIPFTGAFLNTSTSVSGSSTNTWTCSPSVPTQIFSAYPGVTYYRMHNLAPNLRIHTPGVTGGDSSATGSISYSIVKAAPTPVSVIQGPTVGGSINPNPPTGSNILLTNQSYDPDNGGTPLVGICQASWQITPPDGNTYTSSSLNSITISAAKFGKWSVKLTVTDNEGTTADSTMSFVVGTPIKPRPNKEPNCSANGAGYPDVGVNPYSGDGSASWPDPVKTRGHALANSIQLNTQGIFLGWPTPMRNAKFTYGMYIGNGLPIGPSPVLTRYLVDGDATEIDLGAVTDPLSKPNWMFSDLTQTSGGYVLTNAGPPGDIETRGNYSYEFNTNGQLIKLVDPAGNEQVVSYDTNFMPTQVTDLSTDRVITFEYDVPDRIARVVENGGAATTHLTYDSNDKLASVTLKDSLGTTVRSSTISYDTIGRIDTISRDGVSAAAITFSYYDAGDGVYMANISSTGTGTNYTYGATPPTGSTHRVSRVNAKGGITYYDSDADGNLLQVTQPTMSGGSSGPKTTYTYDSNRQVITKSNGATTITYTYDSNGLLTREEDNAGKFRQYTYLGNNLSKIEDNVGTIEEYTYLDSSFPNVATQKIDGAGNAWTFSLNAFGQRTGVTPPVGSSEGTTVYSYDEGPTSPSRGLLDQIVNGNNESTIYGGYTALGDVTAEITSPSTGIALTRNFDYDAQQRLTQLQYDDGKTVNWTYNGRYLATMTDEASSSTNYTFCPTCGKLTSLSEPLSRNMSWGVDSDGSTTTFTDPRSNTTTYLLGAAKETKEIQYPDASKLVYKYDNFARLKSIANVRGGVGTISYNASGIPTAIGFGSPYTSNDIGYTYFSNGLLQTITSNAGVITYSYTATGKVASVAYNYSVRGLTNVQTVEYTYLADDRIDTITWKNASTTVGSWTYSYDAAGRIAAVTNSFGQSSSFSYDGEGKVTSQTNGNNTSVHYTYYEPRGWLTQIDHQLSGTSFERFDLEYDNTLNTVGNVTKVTDLAGNVSTYAYDALYRLTQETRTGTNPYSTSYAFDVAGNITTKNGSTFATYDAANKISSLSGGGVAHDTDGNLITITSGTSGVPGSQFGWNFWDRLGNQKNSSSSITYNYVADGLGRRAYSGPPGGTSVRRYYIFAGNLLLGEILSGNIPQVAYTWSVGGLASQYDIASSSSRYYHFGPQGETRVLTNSSGAVTDLYLYNAWGVPIASSGTSFNPHRYGGRVGYYTDGGPTGVILATHRWYNPYLMRWISRDPIGYTGGTNLYEYVQGRPTFFIDQSGLSAGSLAAGASVVVDLGAAGAAAISTIGIGAAAGAGVGIACLVMWDDCTAAWKGYKESCEPRPIPLPMTDPRTNDRSCSVKRRLCEEECYDKRGNGRVSESCLKRCQELYPCIAPPSK